MRDDINVEKRMTILSMCSYENNAPISCLRLRCKILQLLNETKSSHSSDFGYDHSSISDRIGARHSIGVAYGRVFGGRGGEDEEFD